MSSKFRNPFKLRASEKIESEVGFLRLFSPHVLEALQEKHQKGELWENVLLIHSSPGGGKTSLLRAFEPASLITLLNTKSSSEYKDLFNALKKIEVISSNQVKLLGISLQCTRNYQVLEDLDVSEAQKKRLFFSLINSRVILATLRSACKLKGKRYPDDLKDFKFQYNNEDNFFKSLQVPCNGEELNNWASGIERQIYRLVDSFLPIDDLVIEGHDELISILTLNPKSLTLDGNPICSRMVFMFDDAHKLSFAQRASLKQYIFEKRGNHNIWISERLEALKPEENLGSFKERDFQVLNLENFWRNYPAKLSKILQNISDKRAAISTEEVTSFQEYLTENLNEENIKEKLTRILEETEKSLMQTSKYTNRFDDWVRYTKEYDGSLLDKALLMKEVEILINRNMGKPQLSLDFPLAVNELHEKMNSDVVNAAKLFMSINYELPYYYSFKTLVKLASFNIEQFLSFSAEMFEEMISKKIRGDEIVLSDSKQNSIIKRVADVKWKKIDTEVPYAENIQKFLKSFGAFSKQQTYKANAPYAPGVSGFSIKPNKERMFGEELWMTDKIYEPLIEVISTCVAYNLLEKQTVNQGKKGQVWDVYYLNRWLCVIFGLPLSYGGFRHKSPDELIKWIK
ncbi:hypothetical protein [uncultured Draconibacterium sp.]|uniref:ORC-CDC6 family AAA ATPase n=1 Tax=uncultured Draconibacterium sp. TaxID=1573823 RepID=UPI003217BFA9